MKIFLRPSPVVLVLAKGGRRPESPRSDGDGRMGT